MNDQIKFTLRGIELPLHMVSIPSLKKDLDSMLATERQIGAAAYGPGFVNYLHIYNRPEALSLMPYENARVGDVEELFHAVKNVWPEDAQYLELDDHYWDALSIYRQSASQSRRKFPAIFRSLFMRADTYAEHDAENKFIEHRNRTLNRLTPYLADLLFAPHSPFLSMFSLGNADNENTSFAPYVFYGHGAVILVGKKWIL